MGKPLVSVVMSVYNGERFLREAVESILSQTYTDFEFIIVDDGSTDKTYEILASYKDRRLKVFRQPHLGVIKGRNYALSKCRGVYIAHQDADDISTRDRLEVQVDFLETHPKIGGVGSYVYMLKEGGALFLCTRQVHPKAIRRIQLENKGTGVTQGSLMHRRCVIDEIGMYDERFRFGAEDYEFLLRMAERFDLSNIPRPLYIVRIHPNQISTIHREEQRKNHELARRLSEKRKLKDEDLDL